MPFLFVDESLLFSSHQPKIHAPKINMEPQNHPFDKEHHLNQAFIFGVPMLGVLVNFSGCNDKQNSRAKGPPFPLAGLSSPQEIGDLSALRCCKVGPGIPVKKWSDGVPLPWKWQG